MKLLIFLLGIVIGWIGAFRFIDIWLNRGSVPYRELDDEVTFA